MRDRKRYSAVPAIKLVVFRAGIESRPLLTGGFCEFCQKQRERQGEIALSLLKWDIKKRNVPNKKELQSHIEGASKNTEIPVEELRDFYLEILGNVYKETINMLENLDLKNLSKPSRGKVGFRNYNYSKE